MSQTSFTTRQLDVTFMLGSGNTFGDGKTNQVAFKGLRMSASVSHSGGQTQGAMDLRIYGLSQDAMNKLQVIGPIPLATQIGNVVTLEARNGDQGATALVYRGIVGHADADYRGVPDTFLHVVATDAFQESRTMAVPISIKGGADVALMMSNIAKSLGFGFENGGVSVQLSNPYYPGTQLEQIQRIAEAANINWKVDRTKGVLAIWPKGGKRDGAVPLISPDTGMVGYPIKTALGLVVTTIYNPTILPGTHVQVKSSLGWANGEWYVATLDHNLESQMPSGQWFSVLNLFPPGFIPDFYF